MTLGIVIGRFQPLHNGHLQLIDKSRKENDKTLVLIGSINKLPDFKNPLTQEERTSLLLACVSEGDDWTIRGLKDKPTDDEWVQDVVAHVLDFEEDPTKVTLYTGEKDKEWYESNLLYPIVVPEEHVDINATRIRYAWYQGSLWTETELPQASLELLEGHPDKERLTTEHNSTMDYAEQKMVGHPFANPLEPVSFAVIIQDNHILVGKRGGIRGNGQWGLPGGYVQNDETTLNGCIREVHEELGFNLRDLITSGNAQCMVQAVEENLGDLGTRTLGVNYLFVLKKDHDIEVTIDEVETTDYKWIPLMNVLDETELLFYNHNLVTQRLVSSLTKGEQ